MSELNHTEQEPPKDLAAKVWNKPGFAVLWIMFLGIVITVVSWPLRNIALVCWVHGINGYFQKGIRVLPGKPTTFSTGEAVADLPDLVTGFGAFFITVVGLTAVLIFSLRFYGRCFQRK